MKRASKINHGCVGTPTYASWAAMRSRCGNRNATQWAHYGGRGITVCDRWHHYLNFLQDMGERPPEHSLDRIDNNGNYEPGNCRWATAQQQQEHKRQRSNTVWLTFQGKTLSVTDWAKRLGVSRFMLYERIKSGWRVEDALTMEPHCGVSSGGWRKVR